MSTQDRFVMAGIILIGDELLSGRTQDTNMGTIARWLAPMGVQVGQARIIADDAATIIDTVREFSERFDYVFTTGGIGPTHDDITADCIAAAFGRDIDVREDAVTMMLRHYKREDLNQARLRMARIPEGASLIDNPVSHAPGFQTENVFTMAGVPRIMKAMLADIEGRIEGGAKVYSIAVNAAGIGEGDAAAGLAQIETANPGVSIGSYPHYDPQLNHKSGQVKEGGTYRVQFVARSANEALLEQVRTQLEELVVTLRAQLG